MKTALRGLVAASLIATPAFANEPGSDLEKLSYSLGIILGERIQNDFGTLDPEFVLQGLVDSENPDAWKMDRPAINEAVQAAQARAQQEQQAEMQALADDNLKAGEDFLAENASKDDVTVTASGLQYRVLESGTGASPAVTDTVQVHYEGRLINGEVFDSSIQRGEPVSFPLDGVIPGWSEGVQLMKPGAKYEFTIPAALAYGESGTGPIPPNSVLVFEVELLAINPES
jgi:FKBP-type peptidyl-prolyl cis-trans isomerase FklB